MRDAFHDLRNHLAVAISNVEALADGMLEPTPERLRLVLEALERTEASLRALSDACEPPVKEPS